MANQETRSAVKALEALSFDIGRAYYNYKLLLERALVEAGLDRHIKPGMGHILFSLFEEDDCNIKDIVARTQLSFPTITVMLGQMEKDGLIVRERDPEDGRAVRVRLTPHAKSLEPRCHRVLDRLNGVLKRGMTRSELGQLKDLMSRMIQSMRGDEEAGLCPAEAAGPSPRRRGRGSGRAGWAPAAQTGGVE